MLYLWRIYSSKIGFYFSEKISLNLDWAVFLESNYATETQNNCLTFAGLKYFLNKKKKIIAQKPHNL